MIDQYCNDPDGYEDEVLKLIQIEKSSVNVYDSKPINNFFLNTEIGETLHFKFRDLVKIYIIGSR